MRALIQRVRQCSVRIHGEIHSSIRQGILIFLGVKSGDSPADAAYLAERCAALRIFDDGGGKMNLSVRDVQGSAMIVSQFTLYGDARKGNRPSYTQAATPDVAERLYDGFVDELRRLLGKERVTTGVFREMMDVELVNDGPVTVMLESKNSTQAALST
ncbi:MAG: D-tyrosyl-tRNA(Tyr) deacylase [Ignavibacteriales bacterium]|nr:D-tyrosyl-tRNA(Tyr) deacylase [Ignavibacteriales bacterium]